jgi:hypothetical protein
VAFLLRLDFFEEEDLSENLRLVVEETAAPVRLHSTELTTPSRKLSFSVRLWICAAIFARSRSPSTTFC